MKLFSAFAGLTAANNMLPMMMLLDDDSNSVSTLRISSFLTHK